MTTKKFDGAVFILTDTNRTSDIVDEVVAGYFPEATDYHYTLTESTPTDLPVDLFDQVEANRKAAPGSSVLTVYPWGIGDSTTDRRANGKIPS